MAGDERASHSPREHTDAESRAGERDRPAARDEDAPRPGDGPERGGDDVPACDLCGASDTEWVRCKLVCRCCHAIVMSCGDL